MDVLSPKEVVGLERLLRDTAGRTSGGSRLTLLGNKYTFHQVQEFIHSVVLAYEIVLLLPNSGLLKPKSHVTDVYWFTGCLCAQHFL